MYFNVLTGNGMSPPQYYFPCKLQNLPDDGQKWLKHAVHNNRMYSLLKVVFILTRNTDIYKQHIFTSFFDIHSGM